MYTTPAWMDGWMDECMRILLWILFIFILTIKYSFEISTGLNSLFTADLVELLSRPLITSASRFCWFAIQSDYRWQYAVHLKAINLHITYSFSSSNMLFRSLTKVYLLLFIVIVLNSKFDKFKIQDFYHPTIIP